ncbi:MAG TPA: sugar phosphate isomerase/epimerase family protein [Chloroflexota bacterium]|nr:sugar phosphate isomerase/epimerase family protein [Chloroflexota bacterium]
MRRIGIRTSTLRQEALDALQTAGQLGFDGIELVVLDNDLIRRWQTVDGAADIRAASDRNRCAVCALSCGTYRAVNFGEPEPAVRRVGETFVGNCLRACRQLGGSAILLPHFDWVNLDVSPEREQWYIESLRRCVPVAEETGVTIAIETSFTTTQLKRIVDGVGSPLVGSYHDFANTLRLPDGPVASLRSLGAGVVRIHLKDASAEGTNVPLGTGRVDWSACRQAIEDVGYDDWFVLETPPGDDPVAEARKNLAFSRDWLDGAGR